MALSNWQQLQQSLESVPLGNALLAILFGGLLLFWAWRARQPQYLVAEESKPAEVEPPRNFTLTQLKAFTGVNETGEEDPDVPVYVALKGEVFDVSGARHAYGKEGGYHVFAGHDASCNLAKMSFEEADLDTMAWDKLSYSERDALDNWIETFRHYKAYPVVGRVITHATPYPLPQFTKEQLAAGTGEQEIPDGYAAAPIYVAVKGRVFDVSFGGVSHYGKGCAYHLFAGRDASRALAKMSFEQEHLDHPAISDLTPDERKVLDDWTIRFEKKGYCVVGTYAITE